MDRKSLSLLALIVILAGVLRFGYLAYNPPALNWDEISHGYNAYSILKTGMDQWGQKFPIFNFRAYGDYPTTLNLYLTIPFIAIFGLTDFGIRFPHALLGTLTIISIYFLVFGITKKRNTGLIAAFLAGIEPWYVFTSRFVLQSNLSVFLLITAAALFVNRQKNKYFVPLSFFALFLTLFSYHTTRIFSPLFLIGTLFIYRHEIKSIFIYVLAGLFLILSVYILVNPNATARGNVLFIIDQSAVNQIEAARLSSKLPTLVSKIIYNRPVYFLEHFAVNYVGYFSPQFLFLKGGTQYQFSVPNLGLVYPPGLPFFYIGLVLLIIGAFKNNDYKFLLLWIILSPIPASLTNESYAVIRATTMLPLPEILIGLGLSGAANFKFRKISFSWILPLFFIAIYLFAKNYFVTYFTGYRENYSWSWQFGYRQVVDYVKANYSNYDKIIVTKKYGEPHEYFLFFWPYDPARFLDESKDTVTQPVIEFYQSNWYWVDKIDNIFFINDWNIPAAKNDRGWDSFKLEYKEDGADVVTECGYVKDFPGNIPDYPPIREGGKCLLITSPGNVPDDKWEKLKTINFLDGKPAFEIYDIKPVTYQQYLKYNQ